MRKITLAMVFALTPTIGAFSQISFGVKAGVNFSNLVFTAYGKTIVNSNPAGFNGGVYFYAKFGKFGIQPEEYFSMAGSENKSTGSSVRLRMNYLSIPVLLRYNFTPFINVHAGPQFGILVDAKETLGGKTNDVRNQFKSTDLGLAFGAGFDLPMGFNGGVRYVSGMSNIYKSNSAGIVIKNNIFQIYLGMKLLGR